MERYIASHVIKDLGKKMVIISGPRQSGKTTLARMINPDHDYFNYDDMDHRLALHERSWDRDRALVIFDELHKMNNWKSWLKGVYDTEGIPPGIIVTGSARLDTVKKAGESMAGRFFPYRLHPLDVKETSHLLEPNEALERITRLGGFPEPFLENDETFYKRWRRSHLDVILRQDLVDLESVSDIASVEVLIELLSRRVGTPVSYASLARDLERDPKTIKRWLQLLENMFIIFPVRPYHRNVARSILKEPKYYFFDTARVIDDPGARLENAVACSLLKWLHFREDTLGLTCQLGYVRSRDGREIDFSIEQDGQVTHLIEVKYADDTLSRSFSLLRESFKESRKIQLVKDCSREKTFPTGEEIRSAAPWLAEMDLDS